MAEPWEIDWSGGAKSAAPGARAQGGGPQQAVPAAPAAASAAPQEPWETQYDTSGNVAQPPMSTGEVAADVVKSAAIGPVKGTAAVPGQFGDIGSLLSRGVEKLIDFIAPNKSPEQRKQLIDHFNDRLGLYSPFSPDMPTTADIRGQMEKVTGPLYEPKTALGRIAQAPGEILPAAMIMGPGSAARRVVGGAVVPGVTSELAGQALDESGYGDYARIATGLLTGGINAATVKPETAVAAIKKFMPPGVTEQMVNQAGDIMNRGIANTWPEALSQAAGRPILTGMQRFVESAPQSRDKMEAFMAQRPQQINQAVTEQMNQISPPTQAPAMIGPDAAKAATSTINEVRAAINAGTKKMYDASGQTLVPPDIHASMLANTVFEDALKEVRASPYWRNKLGVQSDRSIAVYDAVKQELNERASQFANPTNPKVSAFKSSEAGSTAAETRAAAIEADKIATGGPSSYEAALQNQADLRQKWLTPLQHGPLGQIADAPTTQRAINALFPANAASVSATEVSDAVKGVARHNAQAAQQLVRQHLSMELNNAFEAASSPEAAQFAGARFAKNVAGSPVVPGPKMENLKAVIESLPGREGIWPGVQRMLEAAQATGWRAPKGSLTAFNLSEEKILSSGHPIMNVIKHAASPESWWGFAEHAIGRWQLRGNLNQVADIITDPKSTPIFRTLATLPPTSVRAQALVARLIAQNAITSSARSADQIEAPKNQ